MLQVTLTQFVAAALASSLLVTPISPGEVPEETPEPSGLQQRLEEVLPVQTVKNIPYDTLEAEVRANNAAIQSFGLLLTSIRKTDAEDWFSDAKRELNSQLRQVDQGMQELSPVVGQFQGMLGSEDYGGDPALQAAVLSLQLNQQSLQGSADMLRQGLSLINDLEDAANEGLDDLYRTAKKQLEQVSDLIVISAQDCHMALTALALAGDAVDRQIEAADRQMEVAEARAELGMLSSMELERARTARQSLTALRDALYLQEESLSGTLAQLCGYDADTAAHATALPQVEQTQLDDMDWERDLKEAQKNSYAVWSHNNAMQQLDDAYDDGILGSDDAADGAKRNRDAAKQSVERTLRQLFGSVELQRQQLELTRKALENGQKSFEVAEAKYQMGMLSELQFLDAQNLLAAQENNVRTAEIQLLAVYNQYTWAKRGIA